MTVRGTEIPVTIETEGTAAGRWTATVDGETYNAASWGELRSLLIKATDVEVNVPFTLVSRPEHVSMQGHPNSVPELYDGVTRRPHASEHRTVLVTWADGVKGSLRGVTTLRPMEPEIRQLLEQLLADHHRISGQIAEIIEANKIDLPTEVERARGELLTDG